MSSIKRDLLKDGFRAESFRQLLQEAVFTGDSDWGADRVAALATKILRECLGEPVRVYGEAMPHDTYFQGEVLDWHDQKDMDGAGTDTHTALLVCVEKVEGEK